MFDDLDESRVTYPRFFTDADDRLYFAYRQGGSGNGDILLHRQDASTNDHVLARMQNELSEDQALLFWRANGSRWTGALSKLSDVSTNDDEFHTYLIDAGSHPEWTGWINQIRLDPLHSPSETGYVHVDRIAVGPRPALDGE